MEDHIAKLRDEFALAADLQIQCELYKLLIYEQSGHFDTHKDTEKSPGMFATMAIVVPSAFSGGDLTIEHGGKTRIGNLQQPTDGMP